MCVSPIKQRYLIIFLSFFSNSQIIILSPLLPSVNDQVGVFVTKFLIIIFLGGWSGERGGWGEEDRFHFDDSISEAGR